MSTFADRRSYVYEGKVIDRQTHLGYDLASLRAAPVEATQNGIVVYADNLGIYGNTVVPRSRSRRVLPLRPPEHPRRAGGAESAGGRDARPDGRDRAGRGGSPALFDPAGRHPGGPGRVVGPALAARSCDRQARSVPARCGQRARARERRAMAKTSPDRGDRGGRDSSARMGHRRVVDAGGDGRLARAGTGSRPRHCASSEP